MNNSNPLKRIYDLYTSDLKYDEIERLIKRESADVYEFFASDIPKQDQTKNKFFRSLIFIRSLFNAFLLKMSAARRIFYIAAILIFIIGYIQSLGSYIILAFILINLLLAFELADKLTAKDELSLARKIQSDLIPQTSPQNKFYDIAAHYESAHEVGGDYYDFIELDEEKKEAFLVIGDISGKGMPAALHMVRAQALIHTLIKYFNTPKDVILNLKQNFAKRLRKEYFLTIIGAKINNDESISLCSAGHLPLLMYSYETDSFNEINPKGIGIGLNDKGIFESTLEEIKIMPGENDILFIYTDGVSESMNRYKEQFGLENIKNIIKRNKQLSPEELKTKISSSISNFVGDSGIKDDLTMIIIKKR
ncbi:MAG: PP2C family protein-serine/threonine phosphatase [Melioribacteraceae bacterium]|nr:PP2C family protein-serine/threonine phosphatase [Melioribacteraceae bacterium]MCF8353367.1 PP2C family protein-serine/threonine phosphatase [Melioribacteraceae bacterium]MCF8393054.1 PP2C family protein-serine/threonine phosphatase [Melioribacteraceae bacterium]MCF8419093.1 PP2C family protein-serine/threonine phosphatase [Melioribacteraceae bacterium]